MRSSFVRRTLGVLAACALICASVRSVAHPVSWTLEKYEHTTYGKKDGAPQTIAAVTQDSDGLLWLTADRGVVTFDGHEFRPFAPLPHEHLINSQVFSLFAPRGGGIWITYGVPGVSFISHGHITNYDVKSGWSEKNAKFFTDKDGDVFAYAFPGIYKFSGSFWKRIDANEKQIDLTKIFQDKSYNVWGITESGKVYLKTPDTNQFIDTNTQVAGAFGISVLAGGYVFVSTRDHLIHQYRATGLSLSEIGSPLSIYSPSVFEDSHGNIWIGSADDGVHFLGPVSVLSTVQKADLKSVSQTINQANGLTGNFATVFEDREGDIWVVTENGADRFRPTAFSRVVFPAGMTMISIAPGASGDVWLGSENAKVFHVVNDKPTETDVPWFAITMFTDSHDGSVYAANVNDLWQLAPGAPSKLAKLPLQGGGIVRAITRDHEGRIWASMRGDFSLATWNGSRWIGHNGNGVPLALATDPGGIVWAGFDNRLVSYKENAVKQFSAADGLSVGIVKVITPHAGSLWIGGDRGLQTLQNGVFKTLTLEGSLGLQDISGVVFDHDRNLWVHTLDGLFRISAESLEHAPNGLTVSVPYRRFDSDDGLPGTPSQMRALPSIQLGSDGRLWISGGTAAAWLDPEALPPLWPAPKPVIRSLSDGMTNFDVSMPDLRLPKEARDIQIDYTSPELARPTHVRFQYRLNGFDSTWQNVGARRQAFYSHLRAGHYTFLIRAANEGQDWTGPITNFQFNISPFYFEMWWFRASLVLAALAVLWLLFRVFVYRAARRLQSHFRIRIEEREAIARDLHDTLLQSTQGLALHLDALSKTTVDPQVQQGLRQLAVMTNDAVIAGRDRVSRLRSDRSATGDLIAELTSLGEELSQRCNIEFRLTVKGPIKFLKSVVEDESRRILGEALVNAFQHASATGIYVELCFGFSRFEAVVSDNGVGIPGSTLTKGAEVGHWGIKGMHERAKKISARLNIQSVEHGGTKLVLSLSQRKAYVHRFGWTDH